MSEEFLISLKTLCKFSMSSFLLAGSFRMASTLSVIGSTTDEVTLHAGEAASEYADWEQGDCTQSVWMLPEGEAATGKLVYCGDWRVAPDWGEKAWDPEGANTDDSELPPSILLFNFWKSNIFSSIFDIPFLGVCAVASAADVGVAGAIFKQRLRSEKNNLVGGVLKKVREWLQTTTCELTEC